MPGIEVHTAIQAGAAHRELKRNKSINSSDGVFNNMSGLAKERLLYNPRLPDMLNGEVGRGRRHVHADLQ